MENPGETGILPGDSFSHQYEVNSNEKVYSEGTTGKVETGGEMEKTSVETRDADGSAIVEGEDGFHSAGIDGKVVKEPGNGLGDRDAHGDDDVVMADVDAEDGYVGGAGEQEEGIGNGGLDQAQPAVVENGKQNGRPCDPFASPDDQPMPQAESPAIQNIYDLQSSWPHQQHQPQTEYEDPQRKPDECLNQEETHPAEVISDEESQEYPSEAPGYVHSEQNLEEGGVEKVSGTGSGDYSEEEDIEKEKDTLQEHLDPYKAARVDHSEQKDIEKEKDTPHEFVDPYEAARVDQLEQEDIEQEEDTLQEHLDPYDAARADYSEEKDSETEKDTPKEHLDLYEASREVYSEEKISETEKDTPKEHLDPYEASRKVYSEEINSETEKDTPKEHLEPSEASREVYSEERDSVTEKDTPKEHLDPYEASREVYSEEKNIDREKDFTQGFIDPYENTGMDNSEENDIAEEKETRKEYADPYDAAPEDVDEQVTTELQQAPVQNSVDPYTSAQGGIYEKEEVHESKEVSQEYAQESKEPAPTTEHEIVLDQGDLQKSEDIAQEYQSETVDPFEKVQGEKEEDIAQLSRVEHPSESMEMDTDTDAKYKDIEKMESDVHGMQETLTEASFMHTPLQTEEEDEKEDHELQHQQHTEEQEQEQLLDPYAPENADMDERGDTLHPQGSEHFGDFDQPAQQDSIQPDYSDASLIGAEFGAKEAEIEFAASAPLEEKDMADDQQLPEGDHELTHTMDDQVDSRNMQAELPIDPIDAVFKANSQENLLGLDPEAAVHEREQDETAPENLEPVLESEPNVTSSHLLEQSNVATPPCEEAQSEVVHDSMQAPSHDREDVNVDQDTAVSSEVDTESFQSGSVIPSSDPLVSQGLSQVDVEPSQQSIEDISTHIAPINVQESDSHDGIECQEEKEEPERYEEEYKEPDISEIKQEEREAIEQTSQGKASGLPLLDLGDGPVQSLSIADADQSPGQRSFEGSFSPIEDNVAVSLALEDQGGVMESEEQEESDDDANTETTEVEAELKEDNFEQQIQQEEESAYSIPKEVPTEDTSHKDDLREEILEEIQDTSEAPQSEIADTSIDDSDIGHVQGRADISPEIPDTMQTHVETHLPENERADDDYNQIQQELPEDSTAGTEVDVLDEREDFSSAVEKISQELSPEPCEHAAPDIVMQEYEEEVPETEHNYSTPDVTTDTTLQNTAEKLLGETEETDAIIMERSRASATPPNTPEVISSSPPDMASDPMLASVQETMQKEGKAVEDQLAPEAEQMALYDGQTVQSEEKQEPSIEDTVKHEVDKVLESAPEEPPSAAPISDEKTASPEITTPSVSLPAHTPELPAAKSTSDEAKEKKLKSSPAQQKKPKTPTGTKSPSKKPSPSTAQKVKTSSEKSKGSDIPKKTAALSRSQPKASAALDRKEAVKAPSKSPAKAPSKTPSKTPAKVPAAKTPAKVLAATPAKASPKVSSPTPIRAAASAKKTTGPASAGATPTRSKTAPPKLDTKPSESKPKQDKVKMSGVKQKTVTTVTKTTHTEVKSAKSSPRKSADGDSPRVRHSPGRNGVSSKIGSLDNSRHSPGGGNVKIQSEKTNYSKVQSRCGSLGNSTHKAGGGNVKILHDPVTFSKPSSRVGSLENAHHSPHGGKVKILHDPVSFPKSSVSSKIGSLDNAQHSPGGGNVKIMNQSADFSKTAKSKIGSLDNATHSPGGGKVKIENKKVDFSKKVTSKIGSLDNATHKPGGGKVKIENKKLDFKEKAASKIGSKDNIKHQAGGGQVKIENKKLDFKEKATSKVGSKDNIEHKPGGGQVKIQDEKLEFSSKAQSKVGSMDNAEHKPSGGDVKIFDEKPTFQHVTPHTDDGIH